MILAVYGKSCSGKTILSNNLSELFSIEARHCGDMVRALAAKKGIAIGNLTQEDHRHIDEATRAIVSNCTDLIVEGCFLDCVLAGMDCILVELCCDDDKRRARYETRMSIMPFESRESSDRGLRRELYGDATRRPPNLSVDTTNLETEETVQEVREWLQARGLVI